jgi:hypothetical protein
MVCASAGIECYLIIHTNQAVVEISANFGIQVNVLDPAGSEEKMFCKATTCVGGNIVKTPCNKVDEKETF